MIFQNYTWSGTKEETVIYCLLLSVSGVLEALVPHITVPSDDPCSGVKSRSIEPVYLPKEVKSYCSWLMVNLRILSPMVNQRGTHCFMPFCAPSSHNLSRIDKTGRPGNKLASWLIWKWIFWGTQPVSYEETKRHKGIKAWAKWLREAKESKN